MSNHGEDSDEELNKNDEKDEKIKSPLLGTILPLHTVTVSILESASPSAFLSHFEASSPVAMPRHLASDGTKQAALLQAIAGSGVIIKEESHVP
jgi:hypothetical protein